MVREKWRSDLEQIGENSGSEQHFTAGQTVGWAECNEALRGAQGRIKGPGIQAESRGRWSGSRAWIKESDPLI